MSVCLCVLTGLNRVAKFRIQNYTFLESFMYYRNLFYLKLKFESVIYFHRMNESLNAL